MVYTKGKQQLFKNSGITFGIRYFVDEQRVFDTSQLHFKIFKDSAVVKFVKFHLTDEAFDLHFAFDKRGLGFIIKFHCKRERGFRFGNAKISDKV